MKLTTEEKTLITDRLNYYAIRLMEVLEGQPSNESNNQRMEDLLLIKSIFEKLLVEDEEIITGVLTTPSKEPRTIDDIYRELSNHPNFVAGSYYDKDSVIDIIISQIEYDYDDDDKLVKDAEEIYENNAGQIFKNIDNAYDYGMEHVDFTEGCDLTLEKKVD